MGSQQFSIQQNVFEIETGDRAEVHQLQNRISRLVNDRLTDKMKEYFNRIIPENVLFTIDSLSYDIGEVSLDDMEDEIEERFMKALEEDLSARLFLLSDPLTGNSPGIRSSGILTGKAELLEHFLLTGTMPWWSQSFADIDLEEILDDCYTADRTKLKDMLIRVGKKEYVRKRMVNQFSEKAIQQIIRTVEYTEAEYIFKSHKEIVAVQAEKQLVKTGATEFNKAVWLFILHYLMVEQSSNFNRKMFVKSNLVQLAAFYNIAFHDVLHVFYDALEQESGKENFVTLQKFIKEIFDDEAEFISPKYLPDSRISAGENKGENISGDIVLLEYYLGSGTLPYVYEKLSSKALAALLLKAVAQYPAQARKLFFNHTLYKGPADHLYKLLGPARVKKIFALVFPGEERKLGEIAAILQALQVISPFVKLSGSELNAVLWQFIFDAEITSGNSAFSEDDVIIKVIDRLEAEYGSERFATWHLLAAAIENAAGSSVQHQQAFKKIQEITAVAIKRPGENMPLAMQLHQQLLHTYENETSSPGRTNKLKDVVRYLLQYGSIPWWGEGFYHVPVADMLLELYRQDKPAFVLLVRQAIQLPPMKKRLLDNIPAEIINELLHELPQGTAAALYVKEFSSLLYATAMMQYYNTSFIQKSLFAIAVEVLAGAGYNLFSASMFYKEAIIRLSGFLKMKPEGFVVKMMQAAVSNVDTALHKETLLVLQLTAHLFNANVLTAEDEVKWRDLLLQNKTGMRAAGQYMPDENISQPDTLLQLQKFLPGINITTEDKPTSLPGILDHFLTWHKLPDGFVQYEENEKAQFIRQLLLYLFQHNKLLLQSMLLKPAVSAIARMYIIELFADHKDTRENELFIYLSAIDIAAMEDQQEDKPVQLTFQQTEAAVYDTSFSLEEFFTGDNAMQESMPKAIVYKRSLAILEYFLRYNKLPDDVQLQSAWKMNLLLKEMIVFLFNNDPAAFQQLLDKQDISIEAKLHLYDLFAVGSDIVTDKIAALMDVKRENDFIQFLLSSGVIAGLQHEKEITAFVNNYLEHEWKIKRQDSLAWLMSSPSFAKIILEKSGLAALVKFAEQKISWSFGNASIIQIWLGLIQSAVSSSFDRERMIELFKRFNINFISGTVAVNSEAEYSNAFLDLLSEYFKESMKEIYKMLFAFTGTAASAGLQPEEIKRLLILLRHKLQQEEERQMIHTQTVLETEIYLSAFIKEDKEILPAPYNEYDNKNTGDENKTAEMEKELLKENTNGFYIRNAGLILFHPFLETFFTRTGLMEKRMFISDAARYRAVLLLQYLAGGKTENEEHELLLNKILCGVPIVEPVPVRFIPSQQETEICEELFKVFIERWPKMKNATPEGMRESLILRNGVLKINEEEWHMRVEQKGYDIILQTLPWAFGFIKTAWMDKALITEWI